MIFGIFLIFMFCLALYYIYSCLLELDKKYEVKLEKMEWRVSHIEDKLKPQAIEFGSVPNIPENVKSYTRRKPKTIDEEKL